MDNPFDILLQQNAEIIKHLQDLKAFRIGLPNPDPKSLKEVDQEERFTIAQLAEYLKCSKVTIHAYKNNGVFPFYKAGRTVFFKRSEVDEAMSSVQVTHKKRP
jgi:excisionase family DNA binding protein